MNTPNAEYQSKSAAFTLIELLTVIAIIGILAAIIIPVVGQVRKTARNAECLSNLRNTGTAFALYAAEHKDALPYFWQFNGSPWTYVLGGNNPPTDTTDYLGIKTASGVINVKAKTKSILLCPQNVLDSGSSDSAAITTYGMNEKCGNPSGGKPPFKLTSASAASQTALLVEMPYRTDANTWSSNANASTVFTPIHGSHSNVLYLDGHVGLVKSFPAWDTDVFWNP